MRDDHKPVMIPRLDRLAAWTFASAFSLAVWFAAIHVVSTAL